MKNINKVFSLLLLTMVFLVSNSLAQTLVSGKVEDAESGLPLAYATVNVDGKESTVTNSEGMFTLKANKGSKLMVSFMGYQAIEISDLSTDQPLVVKLKAIQINLDEVKITSNPAKSLMDSAFKKAYLNAGKRHYAKAFIRQLSSLNDNYTGISESFFDAQYSNFAILGWNPTQTRSSKSEKNISLSNFNFISFASVGYLSTSVFATPLAKNASEIYNFKVQGYIKDGEDDIAIIECSIKDKKSQPTIMYFEGRYFINTDSYNVSKITGFVRNFKLNSGGPVKLEIEDSPMEAIYTKSDNDSQYILKYANLNVNAKIKYAGLLGGGKLRYTSQVFILAEQADLSKINYNGLNAASKDVDILKEVTYDPNFWKDNPVIKRTPLEDKIIEDFEKKKMIGNYFNKNTP
ncbi:carboxypeptidase-like regulatory domain-containing protein [Pedobacter sp. MR22-3]|uniref:carboxypeptidase-like regulatory domain-containing protein n=1 Tax=Pedobacter sp. MR22-3 TaxID=2994552 RepID=UPI0022471147|nr:carboxypeptidase-like regulatory domain-containing protein [Pedobacter sp. MR22-3]MCX2584643.1 carboxypeptidase-like regulatory domain-containing protein [Pedobacter sp. MR22-3]